MKTGIFDGISDDSIEKMRHCFKAKSVKFNVGETIAEANDITATVGILIKGVVEVIRYDIDGNKTILERIEKNGVFGNCFSIFNEDDDISWVCIEPCDVLFVDYSHLIKRCPNACEHHSMLVSNMLEIISEKSRDLSERIEILSQRTLRKKLITYFLLISKNTGKTSFSLPFSLNNLADYLCVDRSAMLREMKKMREDEIIDSHAKNITLLNTSIY